MRKRHLFALVVGALTAAAASGAARGEQAVRPAAVLPYRTTLDGHLLVEVRLNHRFSGTFLFDTGSTMTALTDTAAKRFGLASRPVFREDGETRRLPDGTPVQMTRVPVLHLGSLGFRDVECAVLPEEKLSPLGDTRVDGFLGMHVLAGGAVLLDFEARQIRLWARGKLDGRSLADARMEGAPAVPLSDATGRLDFCVRASFGNGLEEQLLVDTGVEYTRISQEAAARLELQMYQQHSRWGVFGGEDMDWSRVARISLGSISLENHIILSPTRPGVRSTPRVGVNFLSHFRVLLDFPGEQMYLKPVRATSPAGITLPLVQVGAEGMPAVRARLDDGKERLFLLFLGDSASRVSLPTARELLGEAEEGAAVRATVRLGRERAETVDLKLRVDDFAEYGLPPMVEGILAEDFLDHFALTLDLGKGEAQFFRDGGIRQVEPSLRAHAPIPLRWVRGRGWFVKGRVNGEETEFRLDSWDERSVLGTPLRVKLGLKPVAESLVQGEPAISLFRTREVIVGRSKWLDAVFGADPEDPEDPKRWGNAFALDFLRRYRVVLDFPATELYLLPREQPTDDSAREKVGFGLLLEADREGRLMVVSLLAPSPAQAAGIALGDEVLAIDGPG